MRSPQLALCAALAACAVTTAPAYGANERGAGTGTVSVTPASAERVPAGARTRPHTAPPGADAAAASRALTPRALSSRVLPSVALASVAFVPAHPDPVSRAAPRRELSSTSAVGLVLAGGAVLVIAGQLLRLRLRLRRERQGEADEG